jgi:hypothetical protein
MLLKGHSLREFELLSTFKAQQIFDHESSATKLAKAQRMSHPDLKSAYFRAARLSMPRRSSGKDD